MKLRSIIGEKLNMSQMPDKHRRMAPVTFIKVVPNTVIKTMARKALLAFGFKKHISKPIKGQFKALKDLSPKGLREVELGSEKVEAGEKIKVGDVFRKGDLVDVTGTSKGKGFAGTVKRHGFAGGPRTHGQSDRLRAPGSIGANMTPGRVLKGLRMAGHMGSDRVTIAGLEIIDIDEEQNLIKLKGAVPGSSGTVLLLERSSKKRKAYHEPEIPSAPVLGKEEKAQEALAVSEREQVSEPHIISETKASDQNGEENV